MNPNITATAIFILVYVVIILGENSPRKLDRPAAALTRAPHVQMPSTKVIVRFSNFGGVPTIPDNDPNANPRGFAIRFYLAPHVHTDIIGHSHNGFPTRTGEEFLELARALATSSGRKIRGSYDS